MEKAIRKTLIYADIFDYPLKINELHKWLIGRKVTLRQLNKALKVSRKYYSLKGRNSLVLQRKRREKQSEVYFKKAAIISQILKIIPWIKLVGVSGGLAMNNAGKTDDIDLFIITGKNRLWTSRLLVLSLLSLIRQRRKKNDSKKKVAGKICLNILLEEDRLEQKNKDIFVAHEVLQMRPLWQRGGIYSKFLEDNSWAFKFLPNWLDSSLRGAKRRSNLVRINSKSRLPHSLRSFAMTGIENFAKWLQLRIMQKPQGMERIEDGALYFHPEDIRKEVLRKYNQSLTSSASF